MPSTDPMLTIRAGSAHGPFSGELAGREARRRGTSFWVRVKTRWRLSPRTRFHAASGYSSREAPQFAPALLIRTLRSVGEARKVRIEMGPLKGARGHAQVSAEGQRRFGIVVRSPRRRRKSAPSWDQIGPHSPGYLRFSRLLNSLTSPSTPSYLDRSCRAKVSSAEGRFHGRSATYGGNGVASTGTELGEFLSGLLTRCSIPG